MLTNEMNRGGGGLRTFLFPKKYFILENIFDFVIVIK
jgi:hypothetical protein